MTKDPRLIDELQKATREMTPSELARFKKELARRIPVTLFYAADRARKKENEEGENG